MKKIISICLSAFILLIISCNGSTPDISETTSAPVPQFLEGESTGARNTGTSINQNFYKYLAGGFTLVGFDGETSDRNISNIDVLGSNVTFTWTEKNDVFTYIGMGEDIAIEITYDTASGYVDIMQVAKGPSIMLGYYNNPEATANSIKNGWFYTGDLGKIDKNGYLYITGRCKSVIVTKNGKNIYPEEVEYYLNDNPLISEALVQGIQDDDNDETYVKAQIYPNLEAISEYLKSSVPTKQEIKKIISDVVTSVNSKLPNYKHIKGFIIRDKEFEKTTTQKVKRYGENMKYEKKGED